MSPHETILNFRNPDHVAEKSKAAGCNRVDLELRHLLPTPGRLERQTGNYHQFRQFVPSLATCLPLSTTFFHLVHAVSSRAQHDVCSKRTVQHHHHLRPHETVSLDLRADQRCRLRRL